eukprot:GHUV01012694.1.p1 GENE.GHUV01012694.1~~GHUV01012694.1.p1  ORF type:complete len:189 (+),score=47.36 GHUV01012694.1:123-689(+)
MKLTKGLTWPFLIFTFLSLIVFLAGLAAVQHNCTDRFGFTGPTTSSAFNLSAPLTETCSRIFRFHWFTLAFVGITLLGMMVAAAMGAGLHYSRPFWIGMLAVSTVLMMIMCETFVGMQRIEEFLPWESAIDAILAGAIATTVGLVLLMMAVGTDWEHRRGHDSHDEKYQSGIGGVAVPVQNVRVEERV